MPWAVLLFCVLVVPVGVVSIVLVVLQPLAVGAWCGLCLFTAVTTVLMVSPAVDEVVAGASLDDGCRADRQQPPVDLRWILVHLVEELARHAGHADLIRELRDGSTGR